MIESLQTQLSTISSPSSVDYESHVKKIKQDYEKKLEASQSEIEMQQKNTARMETQIRSLESQIKQLVHGDPQKLMESEGAEYLGLMESEIASLQQQLAEYIEKEKDWAQVESELRSRCEQEDAEDWKEQVRALEMSIFESTRVQKNLEAELKQARELSEQYRAEFESLQRAKEQSEQLAEHYKSQAQEASSDHKSKWEAEVLQENY